MDSAPGGLVLFQKDEIVCGKYRIEALLGKGAFGEVYLAEHINLKVYRAVKCISKSHDFYGIATREADILKNLRHPAIPIIYDIEENDDCVCIIEEFVKGMSLNSFITKHGNIPSKEIADIALQLCQILEYLHSNEVYHADIKPENILYDNKRVYLLDYGNARTGDDYINLQIGTKGYAAPEFYTADKVRGDSDIYAIGVVMLVLATGRKDTKALSEILTVQLRDLISLCINHSRKERIKDVKELIRRLNKIKILKTENENKPLSICFIGAYPHCGVTHCALMTGYYLKNKGFKSLVCEKNYSNNFLQIIRQCDCVKFNKGIYEIEGLKVMPQYYECVNVEQNLDMDRVIHDYGMVNEDNLDEILKYDIICLVTGSKAYELSLTREFLEKKLLIMPEIRTKLRVLINLTDVKFYKRVIRQKWIINPIRVGFFPEITKLGLGRPRFGKKKRY